MSKKINIDNEKERINDSVNFFMIPYFLSEIDDRLSAMQNKFPLFFNNPVDSIFSYNTPELTKFGDFLSYYVDKNNKVKLFFDFDLENFDCKFKFFIPFESNKKNTEEAIVDIFNKFDQDNFSNDLTIRYLQYLSLKLFQRQVKSFLELDFN